MIMIILRTGGGLLFFTLFLFPFEVAELMPRKQEHQAKDKQLNPHAHVQVS
jgi:hypothetical protein